MILIDAMYINNSGGKILLDYLVEELEKTDRKIFYLFDDRIAHIPYSIKTSNVALYKKSGVRNRLNFYRKHKEDFSSVLAFANLPPEIRLSAKVYTYFQQDLFLNVPENLPFSSKVLLKLKSGYLNLFKQNTDLWLVQTDLMKEKLERKFQLKNVNKLAFYPPLKNASDVERKPKSYVYVSNASPHKNHITLIEGFCDFYDKSSVGELTLTVDQQFTELIKIIEEKQKAGYPIENRGFMQRTELAELYAASEYLIYPSLSESFGLGIIEALDNGCKIIGADLPYTYAVCEPSLVFNPLEKFSISEALTLSLRNKTKPSEKKVSNNIQELIALLN